MRRIEQGNKVCTYRTEIDTVPTGGFTARWSYQCEFHY
ncbi:MAG: hypothetical protein VCE75_02685 [Alphaproteobacteria bacterium]